MKDFAQMAFIVVVIWGCVLAAPIFGIIVGTIAAAWFLHSAYKEHKNAPQDNQGS